MAFGEFGILVEYLEAGTDVLALATQNGMVIFLTSILRAPDPNQRRALHTSAGKQVL